MGTLWVVGDSTLSEFDDKYYYPRYGYGTRLSLFLNNNIRVNNIALSGRSSKSYTFEPEYERLTKEISEGDFLIIGFGHNDEKTEADRFTSPTGDYTEEGTFANSLFQRYITLARNAKATPILCTPIVRRSHTGNWEPEELHVTRDTGGFPGGDYAEAVRKLARDTDTFLVDLTRMTRELYEELGCEKTAFLHAWTSDKCVSVDDTHTNIWGGTVNAFFVMKTCRSLNIPGLSENIINIEEHEPFPLRETYLVSNESYKPTVFDANLKDSEFFKPACDFKPTVFGDIGEAIFDNGDFILEETDNGKGIHIAVKNNRGKISKISDGIAMYYRQIPANASFTLKAKVHVNDFFLNNQVSFGLMVRDEIYIDKQSGDVLGDYVCAAPLFLTRKDEAVSCFARRNGEPVFGKCIGKEVAVGDTVDVYLSGTKDGYTAKFATGPAVSGGFDFKLTAIDSEHVYVGLFVSRNADVTFTNIEFNII